MSNWIMSAFVIFVVIIVANVLNANVVVFEGFPHVNLFFWSLVLALVVGFGSRGYVTRP